MNSRRSLSRTISGCQPLSICSQWNKSRPEGTTATCPIWLAPLAGLLWGFDIGWGKGEAVQSVFLGPNSQLTWKNKNWLSNPGEDFLLLTCLRFWSPYKLSCRDTTLRLLPAPESLTLATNKILWTVDSPSTGEWDQWSCCLPGC